MSTLILSDNSLPMVARLTLNRPEKRNALSIALLEELLQQIRAAEAQPEKRLLMIDGAGPAFCAGLDLNEATQPELISRSASLLAQVFTAIYHSKLIVLAAIHGPVVAGGGGLVAACDFVIATEECSFSFPEVHRGLVAAQVAILLQRQLSRRHLQELLLLALPINAQRALELGLIHRIVPANELISQAIALAHQLLLGKPEAMSATKKLINSLNQEPLDSQFQRALLVHQQARASPEAKQAISEFLQK